MYSKTLRERSVILLEFINSCRLSCPRSTFLYLKRPHSTMTTVRGLSLKMSSLSPLTVRPQHAVHLHAFVATTRRRESWTARCSCFWLKVCLLFTLLQWCRGTALLKVCLNVSCKIDLPKSSNTGAVSLSCEFEVDTK